MRRSNQHSTQKSRDPHHLCIHSQVCPKRHATIQACTTTICSHRLSSFHTSGKQHLGEVLAVEGDQRVAHHHGNQLTQVVPAQGALLHALHQQPEVVVQGNVQQQHVPAGARCLCESCHDSSARWGSCEGHLGSERGYRVPWCCGVMRFLLVPETAILAEMMNSMMPLKCCGSAMALSSWIQMPFSSSPTRRCISFPGTHHPAG